MADYRLVEWGFLLVTGSNVLLIGLVLTLLWQRLFPRTREADEHPSDAAQPEDAVSAGPTAASAAELTPDSQAQAAANLIQSAQQQDVLPLGQAMSDSLDLMGRLDEVDGEAYPDWKKTNQAQIDELLSNREDLDFKLDDLKSKLDRAHKLVTSLHGQNREMRGAEAKFQRLSQEHGLIQTYLTETRRERDGLKVTVERLKAELEQLRQRSAAVPPSAAEPPAVDEEVQHELEVLRESLEEERAKLSRTLVEKEFIEQVYIDTDAVTDDYQALLREHAALQEQLRALQARLEAGQSA